MPEIQIHVHSDVLCEKDKKNSTKTPMNDSHTKETEFQKNFDSAYEDMLNSLSDLESSWEDSEQLQQDFQYSSSGDTNSLSAPVFTRRKSSITCRIIPLETLSEEDSDEKAEGELTIST